MSVTPIDQIISSVVKMGFTANQASHAVYTGKCVNPDAAVNWICDHLEDPIMDTIAQAPPSTTNNTGSSLGTKLHLTSQNISPNAALRPIPSVIETQTPLPTETEDNGDDNNSWTVKKGIPIAVLPVKSDHSPGWQDFKMRSQVKKTAELKSEMKSAKKRQKAIKKRLKAQQKAREEAFQRKTEGGTSAKPVPVKTPVKAAKPPISGPEFSVKVKYNGKSCKTLVASPNTQFSDFFDLISDQLALPVDRSNLEVVFQNRNFSPQNTFSDAGISGRAVIMISQSSGTSSGISRGSGPAPGNVPPTGRIPPPGGRIPGRPGRPHVMPVHPMPIPGQIRPGLLPQPGMRPGRPVPGRPGRRLNGEITDPDPEVDPEIEEPDVMGWNPQPVPVAPLGQSRKIGAIGVPQVPIEFFITGFGPFGNIKMNPSSILAKQLKKRNTLVNSTLKNVTILDTSVAAVKKYFASPEATPSPNSHPVYIHLGVAEKRSTISVESRAYNTANFGIPDNDGVLLKKQPVLDTFDLNHILKTEFNVHHLISDDLISISLDPGRYICNYLYFTSLAQNNSRSIFVHVPLFSAIPLKQQLTLLNTLLSLIETQVKTML